MKTTITIFLLCLIFPMTGMAYDWWPKDWDRTDTTLQALVIASLAIDRHQSNQIGEKRLEECGWAKNWIGHHPTKRQNDMYFLGASAGHTLIAIALPKHWQIGPLDIPVRTIWQSFWFGVEVGTIHSNYYQCGLSIGFN